MKIDAVITWVDGNDPMHKQKIAPFLPSDKPRSDDTNGETRYNSEGEIYYCVASILRFAPFVRKIFIVTDEQNPNLDNFLHKNFPENKTPIEIIDHKIIFRGYEEYLPIFNSLAITTCLYRIPDLSENYIYFNDDVFLIRPTKETDFFENDKIIAYGSWRNMLLGRLLWMMKPMKNGRKPVGFKDRMICAAQKLGYKWRYFKFDHSPHQLKKSVLANFYSENPELFVSNISHKFRSEKQFSTGEINYLLNIEAGKAIIKPSADYLLYMKPVKRGKNYVKRKIATYSTNKKLIFCCINSLDQATENDRKTLLSWLQKILNIEF